MEPRAWEPAAANLCFFPVFPSPRGFPEPRGAEEVAGDGSAGAGKGMEGAGAAEGEGDAKGRLHLLQARREGTGEENRISAAREAWDLLTCGPEGRGRGDCGSGGERLSQVSEGAGREGAVGEGPERGGSPAEPGTRCDTAGDRAGRATRCGGDSGHRGDTEGTPRGKPAGPTCLPPSRLLSLTHPLHGFHDQSQFIAGHLRAGSGGRSGARGGEEGAAARPERRSRGGQEEEEEEEEGASRRSSGSFPRGSRGSNARTGRGGAA